MSHALLQAFKLLVGITIPLASFVAGLRAAQPLWLLKRPGLLGRSLLSILLVVPLVTIVLVEWLAPADPIVRAGIVISMLSVGLGPPNLMRHARSRDEAASFREGLNVVVVTLTILYLPAAVAIHRAVFEHHVVVTVGQVARVVSIQALVPFLAGVTLARMRPSIGPRAERNGGHFVNVAMLIIVLFALVVSWRGLVGIGARGWLLCGAVSMVAIVIGHALGGPARATRSVLAVSSAVRFPGLAFLLVSVVPRGERLIPVVLAYVISSAVLSSVYEAAMARRSERGEHGTPVAT